MKSTGSSTSASVLGGFAMGNKPTYVCFVTRVTEGRNDSQWVKPVQVGFEDKKELKRKQNERKFFTQFRS